MKDSRFLSSVACTSIGKEYQPLEEESVKKEGKTGDAKEVIAEMKVKWRARCPRHERKDRKRRR
jgi:hypothetical protein